MTREELIERAYMITEGAVEDLSALPLDEVEQLMTVTQYITDLCLNEVERRGKLLDLGAAYLVPYICDYMVETALTRSGR